MIIQRKIFLMVGFALLLVAGPKGWCDTTYTYSSPSYSKVANGKAKYSKRMNISGTFTMSKPLQKNLSKMDVTPSVKFWNFHDGVNAYTTANSQFFVGVSTTSSGKVTGFLIKGISPKGPYHAGDRINEFFVDTDQKIAGAMANEPCKSDEPVLDRLGELCDAQSDDASDGAMVDPPIGSIAVLPPAAR